MWEEKVERKDIGVTGDRVERMTKGTQDDGDDDDVDDDDDDRGDKTFLHKSQYGSGVKTERRGKGY